MSNSRQLERFGRVTGNTLRRSPHSNRFTDHFVLMKRTNYSGQFSYDRMNGQFQELVSDGDLEASATMMYSLNKQKRWELPALLKESICQDGDAHQDLDFKVLLVEWHLDSHGVLGGACAGLYQTKVDRPERLPRQRYAHVQDLRRGARPGAAATADALHSRVARLRTAKNRGGRRADWRGTLDSVQQEVREAGQRRRQEAEEEEEEVPQLRYEVGYCRPENKYPWRPEMKVNFATSKRSMGTKHRHQEKMSVYLDDGDDIEGSVWDDVYEEVRAHSELDHAPGGEGSDGEEGYLVAPGGRPKPTLGEALVGGGRAPPRQTRQGSKKRRRRRSGGSAAACSGPAKRAAPTNRASSDAVQVHGKGTAVYDPQAAVYGPKSSRANRRPPTTAALAEPAAGSRGRLATGCLPDVRLRVEGGSLRPTQLQAAFGTAYAEARCWPRRFAVRVAGEAEPSPVGRSPGESVYALFESVGEASASLLDCREWLDQDADQPWQVVMKGSEFRLTVYGQEGRLAVSSECLAATFPSTAIFSVQDVVKYLQSALQTPFSCTARDGHQGAGSRAGYGQLSLDVPTVMAELGWDSHICTPDEAYLEMTRVKEQQSSVNPDGVPGPHALPNTCGICYGDLSPAEAAEGGWPGATALATCDHAFCHLCWGQYLRSEVRQGAVDITCPEYGCKTPVDRVTSMAFLSPSEFHAHYESCRDATLARSGRHHRCPNPLCGRVARVGDGRVPAAGEAVMVKCRCRHLWCTQCLEEGHWPLDCQQAKTYRHLLSTKLKTKNQPTITHAQVKRCPGCKFRWEKNGGCPSMVCTKCRLNFCWLCLRPYDAHDVKACRRHMTSTEAVYLDYRVPSRDLFLDIAVEHHTNRIAKALRSRWIATATLASRSAMVHVSTCRTEGCMQPPCLMTKGVVVETATATRHQPLTWARTQQHLTMMSRRMDEVHDIVAFCHEGDFVLEHLAFLLGCLTRRQRKTKWWRAMLHLRFTVQTMEETLSNLPNLKRSESEAVMDRLCGLMQVGKDCLRRLAKMMQRRSSQQPDTTQSNKRLKKQPNK